MHSAVDMMETLLLSHIEFDVGTSLIDCEEKLKKRVELARLALFEPAPIMWTNMEYVVPIGKANF